MKLIIILPILLSFVITLLAMPIWINKAKRIGLLWKDVNKFSSPKISGSGGLIVVLGFIIGSLSYIALQTFYLEGGNHLIEVFALTTSILLLAGIGIIDDLFGWRHGGLRKRHRVMLVLIAAIPLVVINAGNSEIYLPFFGSTNIGLIYPLIFIPLGIVGATTTFNFLAGYNGLEASQGILVLSALAALAMITGSPWLTIIGLCMVASLFGFLAYNKFPAKIFPGDVLTYPVGGLIAIMAILGNYELIAFVIFLPYIAETILKLNGRLKKESFGKPLKDGSLTKKYKKIYGLEHLAIDILEKNKKSKKAYEWEVVLLINALQLAMIVLAFLIFIR